MSNLPHYKVLRLALMCSGILNVFAGHAHAAGSMLDGIGEPPAKSSIKGWLIRDSAEGAAYLARAIMAGDVSTEERRQIKERLEAVFENLTGRVRAGAWWRPNSQLQGDPNLNRFVLAALLDALWTIREEPEFAQSYRRWLRSLRPAVDLQVMAYRGKLSWDWGATSAYRYPNQDVLYALFCAIATRLFADETYGKEAEKAIRSLSNNQMPGGAWHYIAGENESPIYHALVQAVLARYVEITGDVRARKMLNSSARYWHTVLSARGIAEGWSDVWWKQNWLPIPAAVIRTVAVAAEDEELAQIARVMAKNEQRQTFVVSWAQAYTYGWQLKSMPPSKNIPERFLAMDPDFRGAHGRDDNWYFGVTKGRGLRNSFVGAMLEGPEGAPLAAAFRGAQVIAIDGDEPRTEYALSQQNDQVDLILRTGRALLSAKYNLQPRRINGVPAPQDVPSPWQVRQLWSAGSDGVMGTIELNATSESRELAVLGRLPFGPCRMADDGPSTWLCGGLRIRLFDVWSKPKITSIAAAYPSPVDRWDGLEWRVSLQGVQPGTIYRYGVWVGPERLMPPTELQHTTAGWRAFWSDGRSLEVDRDGSVLSLERWGARE